MDDIESGRTHLTNTSASMSSVSTANSAVSVQNSCLHCSLFLFDDKIMIVKRQAATVSGRKVTGLDDMQRLVKAGGGVVMLDKAMGKKDKLSFRGVVDILDVTAADTGGGGKRVCNQTQRSCPSDFQLFFHRPPADQSERWSRQTRSYSTVIPPFSPLDRVAIRKDKARFLENLWLAQARARKAKALVSEELEVDPSNRVRCFWSVFEKPSSAPVSSVSWTPTKNAEQSGRPHRRKSLEPGVPTITACLSSPADARRVCPLLLSCSQRGRGSGSHGCH